MADLTDLNLSLVPQLELETHLGSHILKPPSLHTISKRSWGAGSRACMGDAGFGEDEYHAGRALKHPTPCPSQLPRRLQVGKERWKSPNPHPCSKQGTHGSASALHVSVQDN